MCMGIFSLYHQQQLSLPHFILGEEIAPPSTLICDSTTSTELSSIVHKENTPSDSVPLIED